jgi:hypothetical protein
MNAVVMSQQNCTENHAHRPNKLVRQRSPTFAVPESWIWFRFVKLHAILDDSGSAGGASVVSKDSFSSSAYSTVGRLFNITGINFRTAGQVLAHTQRLALILIG